jgi:hypothetical protein
VKKIKNIISYLYSSPVFTSWGNILTKGGNIVLVLPLILTTFNTLEIKLWFVFQLLFSLKDILDFGLVGNFSRSYAYAYAGSESLNKRAVASPNKPNTSLLSSIHYVSRITYIKVALICFILFLGLGTLGVYSTINEFSNSSSNWLSWLIICLITPITLYGNLYVSFLNGINKVAVVKRWDTLFSLLLVLSSLLILVLQPSILALVTVTYFWHLMTMIRNYYLSRKYIFSYKMNSTKPDDENIVTNEIYPLAIKDFIGGISGFGFQKILDLVLVNITSTEIITPYLFANRLMEKLNYLSGVPFFTKIPYFATDFVKLISIKYRQNIKNGMLFSYLTLIMGVIFIGIYDTQLIALIKSNVLFVSTSLWIAMSIFAVIERYTAMHAQQYTISENKIITHIGLPITGILTIIFVSVTYDLIGLISIPISGIIAYLLFYSWFAGHKSYKAMRVNFFQFEKYLIIPVIIAIIILLTFL